MMKKLSRRSFVQSTLTGFAAGAVAGFPAVIRAQGGSKRLPIAFSTLGCPRWEWKKILDQASKLGFAALELRGLLDEMDLSKSPQFTGARLKESLKDLSALGIKASDLGASARLGEPDPTKRAAQIDEAKRYIELAHNLKSPYVRVFGGKLLPGQTMEDATKRIIAGFQELNGAAKAAGVTLIIESHDEFVTSPSLRAILEGTNLPTAKLLWDAHHTAVAGEKPAETFQQLGKYVRHTHLKDSKAADRGRLYVLTGEGEIPVKETVKTLATNGYKGYYCFEWEKRWHPELAEPEVSIPHYAKVMREYLTEAGVTASL
jgi:sugar phosphate isomerase/epimerase